MVFHGVSHEIWRFRVFFFPSSFVGGLAIVIRIDQVRATRALRDVVAEHGSTWQKSAFFAWHSYEKIPIDSRYNNGDGNI